MCGVYPLGIPKRSRPALNTVDTLLTNLLAISPTGAAIFVIAVLALLVAWSALRVVAAALWRSRGSQP